VREEILDDLEDYYLSAEAAARVASLNDLSLDNPKWSDCKIRGQVLLKRKKSDGTA